MKYDHSKIETRITADLGVAKRRRIDVYTMYEILHTCIRQSVFVLKYEKF